MTGSFYSTMYCDWEISGAKCKICRMIFANEREKITNQNSQARKEYSLLSFIHRICPIQEPARLRLIRRNRAGVLHINQSLKISGVWENPSVTPLKTP